MDVCVYICVECQRQDDHELETSVDYFASSGQSELLEKYCFKQVKKKNKKIKTKIYQNTNKTKQNVACVIQ